MNEDIFANAKLATEARKRSYAPYSKFTVGAILKCKNGKTYMGCNIENDGIQATCAERVAFLKAISEGEREFEYIVIAGGKQNEPQDKECLPCGYCRQFMNEFVDKDFKIYTIEKEKIKEYDINGLLPFSFRNN